MFLSHEDKDMVNTEYIAYIELDKKKIMFVFQKITIRVNWNFKTEEEAKKVFEEIQFKLNSI